VNTLAIIRDELRAEFFRELKAKAIHGKEIHPNFFLIEGMHRFFWVLDLWHGETLAYVSVSDAAKKLRHINRRWQYAGGSSFRRGQLIAEALKIKANKQWDFPLSAPKVDAAAFTLLNEKELFYTNRPLKSGFAGGKVIFNEDKKGPPSRAYLKLWESLSLTGSRINSKDQVLDLGATPGGWSYVALSAGAKVTMIDRARPSESLFEKFSELEFIQGNGLNPPVELLNRATVILSDMACEPMKLLGEVARWVKLERVRLIIATLKFHGEADLNLIQEFQLIGQVYHLWHNGHELTLVWQGTGQ